MQEHCQPDRTLAKRQQLLNAMAAWLSASPSCWDSCLQSQPKYWRQFEQPSRPSDTVEVFMLMKLFSWGWQSLVFLVLVWFLLRFGFFGALGVVVLVLFSQLVYSYLTWRP